MVIPSRMSDMSLPSTRASTLCGVDKSGRGGAYRTPNVETLEYAHSDGVDELPPKVGVG